jgi:hypothetical protein
MTAISARFSTLRRIIGNLPYSQIHLDDYGVWTKPLARRLGSVVMAGPIWR